MSTALCALAAVLLVDWDGCATKTGIAAPILLIAAAAFGVASVAFLLARQNRTGPRSQAISIALVSIAGAAIALTLLGISAANSGCS